LTRDKYQSRICEILELDPTPQSKTLADLVLNNGRQALSSHKDDLGGRIFRDEIESNGGQLLTLLKQYIEQSWFENTPSWFQNYLTQQRSDSADVYEQILVRSANYGSKFDKPNRILSLAVQFVFELSDNAMLQATTFNDICKVLVVNGRQGIRQREDDLSGRVFNEQLEIPKSIIFLALREHYAEPLKTILGNPDIGITKAKVIDIVLDCVTEHGWWKGIHDRKVEDEIAKNKRVIIDQKLLEYLKKEDIPISADILATGPTPATTTTTTSATLQNSSVSSASSISSQPMSSQMSNASSNQSFADILSPPPSLPPRSSTQSVSSNYSISNDQHERECESVQGCIDDRKKLQLADLVMAGELKYTNETFNDVLKKITDAYSRKRNFPAFIRACLTPIMYLLKRYQNLDDFMESLFQHYNALDSSLNTQNLSLRMLTDVLLLNSEFSLSRKVMILLSKRNPVPFLQPDLNKESSFRFVSDIIHVWDFIMPTILSFGIGPCQGKSSLLNNVLLCSFEQTQSSIYFCNTIDIDFGYNFLPRRTAKYATDDQSSAKMHSDEGRSMSIADAHGPMTRELLKKIHSLFDGFLIHVNYDFLLKNMPLVLDQLNVIDRPGKYRLLLVRDAPKGQDATLIDQLNSLMSNQDHPVTFTQTTTTTRNQHGSYPSLLTAFLTDMSKTSDRSVRAEQVKLRDQILAQLPRDCQGDKDSISRDLSKLMDEGYKSHLYQVQGVIKYLTDKLIDTAVNQRQVSQYFPEYCDFVELCAHQLESARFNFFGSDNDQKVYAARKRIYELEEKMKKPRESQSIIYKLFDDVLQSFDMITCLELLGTQLREKQKAVVSTSEMAMTLPIEKSLSLEVLWRNSIVCSHHFTSETKQSICKHYSQYINAGFPFEIVDGDNFYFQDSFLIGSLDPFTKHRILVISIIGPQNSGKSTLLNYMFGTLFDVRDGRCTRGIYGSFVKAGGSDYDYIMLIDTEGLLSIEREDKEYDRRIVLFCLAVSHIVIVNMSGEISTTLQEMLKLCASSLKEIGVKTIPRPIVHFILNQRADLDINNHQATINKVIGDLQREGLNEWIDIRKETFHALPSAFKKEGQTLTSNPKLGNVVRTAPEFIECVQTLTNKILYPTDSSLQRKSEITDPLQWLASSYTVFDTLRKFPDLTYYQDINERRIDNELREHIRNYLTKAFSAEYRDALLVESFNKDEKTIQEIFSVRQSHIHKSAEEEMEGLFRLLKVPENLRKRSREFIRAQIIQMFQAAYTATMAANERKRVEILVQNGGEDLKQLIEETIQSGKQMSAADAKVEFEKMYKRTIDSIQNRYVPRDILQQALRHIYTNYNIYEKDFRYEFDQLIRFEGFLQRVNDTGLSMDQLHDTFVLEFATRASENPSVCDQIFNPGGKTIYSYEIIRNLVFVNKVLLKIRFSDFFGVSSPQPQTSHQSKGFFGKAVAYVSGGSSKNKQDDKDERLAAIRSTDPFQMEIREAIKSESSQLPNTSRHTFDDRSAFLPVSTLIKEVFKRVSKEMQGAENKGIRQIKTELIQRIVGLISSMIIEVKTELAPFCLELSRPLKTILHTCTIILLTKYYYDEQMSHFQTTLFKLQDQRKALEEYFISVVVPNSSIDESFALSLLQQLKDYLIKTFTDAGQVIINDVLKQYEHVNRQWVQDKCDGLLLSNADIQWNLDYIADPNKIIENYFKGLWADIEKSINQTLTRAKSDYILIIEQFFFCFEGMLDTINKCGAPANFVDTAFLSEENNQLNANENLVNKQKCMAILFQEYFTKNAILKKILKDGKTYHLKQTIAERFQWLIEQRPPSESLSRVIQHLSGTLDKMSIKNFTVFLKRLLTDKQKIHDEFNKCKSDFKSMDTHDTYATLLDKVRGCTNQCPCCNRPCDVDHTQIKSNPGAEYNEHRCVTGHSLRAMNGYKFEESGDASLFMCEQIKDDQEIIIGPTRYQWAQYKKDHSDWKFDSALNADELSRLHGKYLTVWGRIGPTLCQQYGMNFVTANTIAPAPQSCHFILLLDSSGSMSTNQRWDHLMDAVKEFLQGRETLKTKDLFTFITFSSTASAVFENKPLNEIDPTRLGSPNGGTSFKEAFKCVKETIKKYKKDDGSDPRQNNITILFMSDGEAAYPKEELEKLQEKKYKSNIKHLWTIALCEDGSQHKGVLEQINLAMDGSFYTAKQAAELVKIYAEIASNS